MRYFKNVLYLYVLIGYSLVHAGSYEDFFRALALDDVRQVSALLQRGFDPNSVSPEGQLALILAMQKDAPRVAEVLVAHPATNVNVRTAKGESPLMLAAIKGWIALCRQLISRDADVNMPGWTPLHYAASNGNPQLVQLMLDHYAYIDAESPNGSTPLMMAAMYGTTDAVKLLLEAGADPSLKNSLGLTALDFAQRADRPEAVALVAHALRKVRPAGTW